MRRFLVIMALTTCFATLLSFGVMFYYRPRVSHAAAFIQSCQRARNRSISLVSTEFTDLGHSLSIRLEGDDFSVISWDQQCDMKVANGLVVQSEFRASGRAKPSWAY